MREVNLRSVDLNLLVVLATLLAEANVTRAAAKAGISQPAMSRALGRLRALLGDPLLASGAAGLTLTPFARAMQPQLEAVLGDVRGLLAERRFDPALLKGMVTFAGTDHQTIMLLPRVMRELSRQAPGLDVRVRPLTPATPALMLAGNVDLGFGIAETGTGTPLLREPLYQDRFVTLLRENHPALGDWTLARFVGLDHVLVTINDDGRGAVDAVLDGMGLTRRIALRLPHFFAAISIVAQTDMVVTLPATIARHFAAEFRLQILATPVDRPPFTVVSFWPPALDADPASRWLRALVRAEAAQMPGALPIP
jgi:DNA-binding transcriptional LysR family regulator